MRVNSGIPMGFISCKFRHYIRFEKSSKIPTRIVRNGCESREITKEEAREVFSELGSKLRYGLSILDCFSCLTD